MSYRILYECVIGHPTEQHVADAWKMAMQDALTVKDQHQIPELNQYQCGTYEMHSLAEAQQIVHMVIENGIGINKNEELTLPKEKLFQLSS